MIAAIMQPYFFPYIGYFQLMQAVDTFVFLDNVQYIDRGWVNRNRICLNGKPIWLTFPVRHASRKSAINQRHYLLDPGIGLITRKLKAAYPGPLDGASSRLICKLLEYANDNVAMFNANLLVTLARALGTKCTFETASQLLDNTSLKGQERIIEICKRIGATHYINPIGGRDIYDAGPFTSASIQLSFIQTTHAPTITNAGEFQFSIIDLLMRSGIVATHDMLDEYRLVKPDGPNHA